MSCEPTNNDHFQTPDYPESDRKWSDLEIGSGRFRMHGSDRNSTNPISRYQRNIASHIGIRQKVTDRIRFTVQQRILNPSDRIRCTHFDLGSSQAYNDVFSLFMKRAANPLNSRYLLTVSGFTARWIFLYLQYRSFSSFEYIRWYS